MLRPLACLLLAAVLATPALAADSPTSRDVWVPAQLTIDPQGHVSALEWGKTDKLGDLVVAQIDAKVRAWEFNPGTIDGVAAETRTGLLVGVRVEAIEGGASLRFIDASTGARTIDVTPPRYPVKGLQANASALAYVRVAIDGDKVELVDLEMVAQGAKRDFEDALRKQVPNWRFSTETVGGRPIRATMVLPVMFCIDAAWCSEQRAKRSERVRSQAPDAPVALDSAVSLKTAIAGQGI